MPHIEFGGNAFSISQNVLPLNVRCSKGLSIVKWPIDSMHKAYNDNGSALMGYSPSASLHCVAMLALCTLHSVDTMAKCQHCLVQSVNSFLSLNSWTCFIRICDLLSVEGHMANTSLTFSHRCPFDRILLRHMLDASWWHCKHLSGISVTIIKQLSCQLDFILKQVCYTNTEQQSLSLAITANELTITSATLAESELATLRQLTT